MNMGLVLEKMGRRIADAQREYERLTTTRRRQLERPLNEIESLRTQREIPVAEVENVELPELEGFEEREDEEETILGSAEESPS